MGTDLQISKVKKNGVYVNFEKKYDLNLYKVDIDRSDKYLFMLIPKNKTLQTVRFVVSKTEDRARWV